MNIKIVCVGKVKEEFYRSMIDKYKKSILASGHNLAIIELQDEMTPAKASEKQEEKIKDIEGERILSYIENEDYVVTLCIEGKEMTSDEFKNYILKNRYNIDNSSLVMVIGGSLGLSNKVVRRSNLKLSFSKLTFPHQLMRVMLMQQLNDCYLS